MAETLTRAERAAERSPSLWRSVPLECVVAAAAILAAAGLKLTGMMP